jgi:hypothetical protein
VANFSPPCAQTLTANPNKKLKDGETITVTGKGFTPQAIIGIVECTSGAVNALQCDINTLQELQANRSGGFVTQFVVSRIINPEGSPTDCATPGACILGAADISNLGGYSEEVATPISFNPKVPPLPPLKLSGTLNPTGTANRKTGIATISGTVTCNRSTLVDVYGEFSQRYHRFIFSSEFDAEVMCTASRKAPGTATWTAQVLPENGTYAPGTATASGFLTGEAGDTYVQAEFSGTVKLTKAPKATGGG